MGLFNFVANIASAAVKVVISPVAIVSDIVEGEPFDKTSEILGSAIDDVDEAFDEIIP